MSAARRATARPTSKLSPTANSDLLATLHADRTGSQHIAVAAAANAHSNTTGFGGFVGYNSQWDDVVVGIEANYMQTAIRSVSDATRACVAITRPLVPQPDPFERGRETLRFRLAARPRRLRDGMLPALRVCRHSAFGSQTVDRTISAYPRIRRCPMRHADDAASKTKLIYGYSAGVGIDVMLVGACSCAPSTNIAG